MKKQLMLICAAVLSVLTILSAFSATAQEISSRTAAAKDTVLAKMNSLIDDDTLAVVYVNVEQIDVKAALNNNRARIEKIAVDAGIPEAQSRQLLDDWYKLVSEGIDKSIADGDRDYFDKIADLCKKQNGIQEVFLIVQLSKIFPHFVYVAIPKSEKLNVKQIREIAQEKIGQNRTVIRETDDYIFIANSVVNGEGAKKSLAAKIGTSNPVERREFIDAYNAVKDDPIGIFFALPPYVKKIIAELNTTLPEKLLNEYPAFEVVDFPQFVKGFRFSAIGLNPVKGKIQAVTEMESELDAQQFAKQADSILTDISDIALKYLESLKERKKNKFELQEEIFELQEEILLSLHPDIINEKLLTTLKTKLLPKPDGKRFTINFDIAQAGTLLIESGTKLTQHFKTSLDIIIAASKRAKDLNNIRQLTLAMHNYHDVNGNFPPAFSVDGNGKPLHSWRVLLTPFLPNGNELYKLIRLDEAWDSEHNKQFHDKMPDMFKCPTNTKGNPKSDTIYCMVTGDKTVGNTNGKGLSIGKITDGTSNTIVIVERQTPVCWMSPEDVTFENAIKGINKIPDGIGSIQNNSVNVGFADGSARTLNRDIKLELLKALLTIAGGEALFP
ncbi:MAG: DUF1559 domain-containing protein [Planctomycetaceae bacterium]|jgi:prepilin-type processing-associated H-X9-DG protein|nr:DUF1559 domain-containing protein [Planctomycetaceae bacterium]